MGEFERKSCHGKRAYRRKPALTQLAELKKIDLGNPEYLSAYRCRFCRAYHIGHAPWLARSAPAFATL